LFIQTATERDIALKISISHFVYFLLSIKKKMTNLKIFLLARQRKEKQVESKGTCSAHFPFQNEIFLYLKLIELGKMC
jgi:hypothetical protein